MSYGYKGQLPIDLRGKKGEVENQEAIHYWTERLAEVDKNIENVTTATNP